MTETRRPGPNGLFLKLFDASEDHGYKIIAERLRAGKHTLKQLIEVFSLRAAMEEDFSRKLSKVAKTLQEKEFGTLLDAIQAFCTHTENMARKHLEFANLIRSSMEQPSLELLAKQKLIREQYLTAAEKNIKHRASTYQQQLRAQAKYALKCHELNTLRDAKETKYGKEHDKLMNKYTKADNSAKILEIELKQAETQSKQSQITWESEWRDSLNIFEELEIERTQLIALKLVTLSNGSKIMAELEKEAYSEILQKASSVEYTSDMNDFISKYVTVDSSDVRVTQPPDSRSHSRSPPLIQPLPSSSSTSNLIDHSSSSIHPRPASFAYPPAASTSSPSSTSVPSTLLPHLQLHFPNELNLDPFKEDSKQLCATHAIALYPYDAQLPEELSFQKGQRFKILATEESGWWMAEFDPPPPPSPSGATNQLTSTQGLIPSNFLNIIQEPNSHSKIANNDTSTTTSSLPFRPLSINLHDPNISLTSSSNLHPLASMPQQQR